MNTQIITFTDNTSAGISDVKAANRLHDINMLNEMALAIIVDGNNITFTHLNNLIEYNTYSSKVKCNGRGQGCGLVRFLIKIGLK